VTQGKTIHSILLAAAAAAVAAAPLHEAGARPPRSTGSADAPGAFGLGLMVGVPSGLSAKLHLDERVALAAGLGVFREFRDHEGMHVHVDVLWHPRVLTETRSFTLPFHVGVGGRLLQHTWDYYWADEFRYYGRSDTHLGVRVPVGLTMNFKNTPLDVFFELAFVVDVIASSDDELCIDSRGRTFYCGWDDHGHADFNGALGARYYF